MPVSILQLGVREELLDAVKVQGRIGRHVVPEPVWHVVFMQREHRAVQQDVVLKQGSQNLHA